MKLDSDSATLYLQFICSFSFKNKQINIKQIKNIL